MTPGTYEVRLALADLYWTQPGKRVVVSVAIEGVTVLSGYDIVAETGGRFRGVVKTFVVSVQDGTLDLTFVTQIDNATVNGIAIVRR